MDQSTKEKQTDLAKWLQIYRDLRSGQISAVYARVARKGHVYCEKHSDSETERIPEES